MVCSIIMISKNTTPKNLSKDESLVQFQEARVPGISFHKWSVAQTRTVWMLECHKCWSISQTYIKHLIFYLPFGCTCVDLKLDPNQNSKIYPRHKNNHRKGKVKSVYKYSKIREENKMCIYSFRVKDVKWTTEFWKPPRDKLINHTSYKYVRSVIYLVPLINISTRSFTV